MMAENGGGTHTVFSAVGSESIDYYYSCDDQLISVHEHQPTLPDE